MDEKFAYFIYIPHSASEPRCVKISPKKVTEKQVSFPYHEGTGYKTTWKKKDIHWSALDAWVAYQALQKTWVFDLGVDLDNARTHLNAADDAIEALLHAERNSPDG